MYKQSSYNTVNIFTGSTGLMRRLMIAVLIPLLLLFCLDTDASAAAYTVNIDDAVETESGTIKFRVWLDQKIVAGDEGCGVSYQTIPGSAADPDDFTGVLSGSATFDNEGDFETTISITLSDDALIESAENFIVTLTGPILAGGGTINPGDTTATGIINDNDALKVEFNQASAVSNENVGLKLPVIVVNGEVATGHSVAVNVTVDGGSTATGGGVDYNDPTTLTVGGGNYIDDKIGIPNLAIKDDTLLEADETIVLNIDAAPSDVTAGTQSSTTYVIKNEDAAIATLAATDNAASEPAGGNDGKFTVSLDNQSTTATVIAYTVTGDATSGSDYTALTNSVTIPADTSFATIDVKVLEDAIVEADETVTVALASVTSGHADISVDTTPASVTISDNDTATVSLAATDNTASEPAGGNDGVFTVSIDNQSDTATVIAYTVTGDATSGSDYTALTNSVTIPANTSFATIDVTVLDDALFEIDETVTLTLSSPITSGHAGISADTTPATVTISDNDTYNAGIGSTTYNTKETDSDFTLNIPVVFDQAVPGGATVTYTLTPGTAASGSDYEDLSGGTLTYTAAQTTQNIQINIKGDDLIEADESFTISLTAGGNQTVSNTPATVTIVRDDYSAELVEGDQSVAEGGSVTYTIRMSPASGVAPGDTYEAYFQSTIGTGGGFATPGDDFTAFQAKLTWVNGDPIDQTFNIITKDDAITEADETFWADLGSTSGGYDLEWQTVTIESEDAAIVTIEDIALVEGSDGGVTNFLFTVTLDNDVQDGFDLAFSVNDGTATDADDFDVVTASPLTFAGTKNETQDILVVVNKDNISEDDESFEIVLGALSNIAPSAEADITTGDTATGTIIYDDYEASMGADITVTEGNLPADDVNLTFTINLDRPNKSGGNIDLEVNTADDTALAGSDYVTLAAYTVSIANTQQNATFNVAVIEDTVVEHDEVFLLNLSTASSNTTIQASPNDRAVGTINNDDQATLAINDVTAVEGADGTTTTFTFTVTLTGDVDQAFTVDWVTVGSSATSGTDFEAASGTLNFAGADTENYTIDVTVNGDDEVEYDETFFVNLSNIAANGKDVIFTDDSGTGAILNDNKYKISVDDVSVDEPDGAGATTSATFTITLHQAVLAGETATVGYATGNSVETPNALAGTDYTAIGATTWDFAAGESTKIVDVTIINDAADIETEYYYFNASASSANTEVDAGTGLGTIVDNEYHVAVSGGANGTISDTGDHVVERSSDFPPAGNFTITADAGYCIADVTRNSTSVLGGIVPPNPYTTYRATDIQDDPTAIEATFRTEIQLTTNIEPVAAQEYGRWRFKDTTNNVYVLPPVSGDRYPTTADPDAAWLNTGDMVVIPCDKSGFLLEYKEVSGWYAPSSVSYSLPPGSGTTVTTTGTYVSKTVQLTLVYSGNIGNEEIGVDPEGGGESGVLTHTYPLYPDPASPGVSQTVTLTASASTTPGAETIFLGWSGASDATTNSVDLVMNGDKTITANFGTPGADNDGDGYIAGDTAIDPNWDCNDTDPTIHPNAIELCGDGIDQDCSGGDAICELDDKDDDGDGYTENQGDCNDNNPLIHPGATEICSDLNDAGSPGNDVDEDCYDGPRDCGTELICSDYSERPLETQAQSAAPNVLFVLDDSGSMQWETMTSSYNGKFYLGTTSYTSVYGNSTLAKVWESQYHDANKIWYNPAQDYVPWPRWNEMDDTEAENGTRIKNGGTPPAIAAHSDTPRKNPVNDGNTFNLNSDFFTVKPVAGAAAPITQWVTVTRDGTSDETATAADAIRLVDNTSTPTPAYTIVVDNSDGADYYEESGGNWSDSSTTNMYLGNARFNKKDTRSATWYFEMTPAQAAAGPYYVQAWWPQWHKWDTKAKYTITYNGGTTTPQIVKNQKAVGGQWVTLGGPYTFIAQETASASSLFVKNAHYFIWVDHDGDETMLYEQNDGATFTNSEVYLINLSGSGGTYEMKFYRFVDDDEDGKVDDDELQEVTNVDPHWDDIQPRKEDGTVRTAAEERQNFANWYSFYRKREYTAKAAIGRTVTGTSGMNIGILGINGRIQEELVPIGVEGDRVKVVDNSDAGFSSSGTWNTWSTSTAVNGNSRWSNSNGDTARFTPSFSADEAGSYDVYAWWPCWTGWDSTTQYTIVDGDGTAVVTRDQRQGGSEGCGLWVPLGSYNFDAGAGYVQVESTGDYVAADAIKFVSTGAKVNVNETDYLLNKLYQVYSSGGTPLRRGLQNAGKYFDNEDSGASGGLSATAPWASAVDGGGCQRAFAILMTDGYYNGYDPSPSVGNEDSDGNRPDGTNSDGGVASNYDSGIFAGPEGQTLADVAMYYYEKDLHKGLANDVPAHNYDTADHQHMVTYGVSFGVYGTLDPADYPNCLPDTAPQETAATCPSWPKPDSDPERIDDLYHASINGRGKYLNAGSPGELVTSLKKIIDAVAATSGTGSSVSINAQELKEGTLLFQASYVTGSWRGDLKAKELDPDTGEVLDTLWSAAEALASKTHATRHIVTYDGATGQHFRFNDTDKDLTPDQAEKLLNWAPGTITQANFSDMGAADITKLSNLVDYLRGDATNEGTATGTYRQRPKKDGNTDIGPLGDIVHSAPQHVAGVVYVGGNDGMLHAFDDTTGEELFAYVPNRIYDDLDELASQTYSHKYYVDNAPYSLMVPDGTEDVRLLVGTLGRGGKGVYALDISDVDTTFPATEAEAKSIVKWEYPNSSQPTSSPGTDDDLGYGFGRAFIVNSRLGYVVIMGNGYQSVNGKAMLYVLDALTGTLLGTIDTGAGSSVECNGLSVPVLIDPDFDGIADYAYAGDLLGNMWKFDLTGNSFADWKVAYNTAADYSGTPQPLFQAKNKNEHRQPITTKPDVIAHPDSSLGGYMVVFGTGRYLGTADFGDNSVQSVYGIWDWAAAWEKAGGTSADKYLGAFGPVTGDPEFGRLSYFNKPVGQDFVVGETVKGATSNATGVIEEIEADSVRLNYSNKLAGEDFVVGDTVTGSTSSATGVIETITESDDTTGYLILKNLSKTNFFVAGEPITSATVSQDAVAGEVVGNTAGSLKLKDLSLTDTFVAGELITSTTVTTGAVAASDLLPIALRPLANLVGNTVGEYVTLLEQSQIAFIEESRFMSNNTPYWFNPGSTSSGKLEHAGWYFDLPGANEKMIRDVLIRNGIAFVISSVPSSSPCASGGTSIVHALDATSGGRSLAAVFDISGPDGMPDGKIDEHDLVNIGTPSNPHYVAPTGLSRDAMWYTPAVLAVADSDTDVMYFSTSKGDVKLEKVEAEKVGVYFWREID